MVENERTYRFATRPAEVTTTRACEAPACAERGLYRAPRAPDDLRTFRWFCLDHVREYNRAWNFFEGWDQSDIERFVRDDVTGHRPTWPVSSQKGFQERMSDLEGMFHAFAHEWFGKGDKKDKNGRGGRHNGHTSAWSAEHENALVLLNLDPPFTLEELKRSYKALVKKHHPDANGGSRESEELLKMINQAYTYLLNQIS